MERRIFITGASGLLGQRLAGSLSESHRVFASVHPDRVGRLPAALSSVPLDLSAPDLRGMPESVDMVIYLAQSPRFREFPGGAADMLNVNVSTPLRLADWALRAGAKQFIYASTGGVYGYDPAPFDESHPISQATPPNFYIDSKRAAELLLRNFAPLFERLLILRPFFIYGPQQHPSMLIPRLIRNVAGRQPILLNGASGIEINPIYVDDAAAAICHLMDGNGFETYNLAGKETRSIRAIAEQIGALLGIEPVFEHQPASSNLIGDISKLERSGFQFKWSLDAGLATLVDSFV